MGLGKRRQRVFHCQFPLPILTLHWLWMITQQKILKYLLEGCHICFLVEFQSFRISDNRTQSETKRACSFHLSELFFSFILGFCFCLMSCKLRSGLFSAVAVIAFHITRKLHKTCTTWSRHTQPERNAFFALSTGCICTLVLYAVIKHGVCSAPSTLAKINKCLKGIRFFQ